MRNVAVKWCTVHAYTLYLEYISHIIRRNVHNPSSHKTSHYSVPLTVVIKMNVKWKSFGPAILFFDSLHIPWKFLASLLPHIILRFCRCQFTSSLARHVTTDRKSEIWGWGGFEWHDDHNKFRENRSTNTEIGSVWHTHTHTHSMMI